MSRMSELMIGRIKGNRFCVYCENCKTAHWFDGNDCEETTLSKEGSMGPGTDHVQTFEASCKKCGRPLKVVAVISEYPAGAIEHRPVCSYFGCTEDSDNRLEPTIVDYDSFIPHPSTPEIKSPEGDPGGLLFRKTDISIDTDKTRLLVHDCSVRERVKNNGGHIYFSAFKRLYDIFVDDLGYIQVDRSGELVSDTLTRFANSKLAVQIRIMTLLGKVAEAVIVRHCLKDPSVNKEWMDKAGRRFYSMDTAKEFRAIGTGLLSTRTDFLHQYSPGNTQRDIVWVNTKKQYLNSITGRRFAAMPAGIQVKTSTDGVEYVLPDLKKYRYEVPIAYFGLTDDFLSLNKEYLKYIEKNRAIWPAVSLRPGMDYFDAGRIDPEAFREIKEYYAVISRLVTGACPVKEFIDIANGMAPLKTAVSAMAYEFSGNIPYTF